MNTNELRKVHSEAVAARSKWSDANDWLTRMRDEDVSEQDWMARMDVVNHLGYDWGPLWDMFQRIDMPVEAQR